jgi:cation-transporting ATPase G
VGDACCAHDAPAVEEEPVGFMQLREVRLAAAAGALMVVGLVATGGPETAAFLAAAVVGGSTFVPEAVRNLPRLRFGVGTLMTIALVGAIALGEYGEAASLAFLFSISEALEGYALARTRRGLRALLALVPERVTVKRGLLESEVDPGELRVGDVMVVRAGERVATDGVIRRGTSSVDLSAVTGESVPVEAAPGATVFAAAINGTGVLEVEVTAAVADNSLARIVHIVEEAQERKGQAQRLAERFARPLVPGIMVAAALLAGVGSLLGDPEVWIGRALVVLVAAAPCALAIAVPVTVVAAIGAASRMGVLIKGGAALEALSRVRIVALDKTGTLTRNRPTVIDVLPTAGATADQVAATAAALERRSDHPLATAIVGHRPDTPPADDVEAVAGYGLTGIIDGRPVRLGKPGYIDPGALAGDVERLQGDGATVVLVEANGHLLGAIAVRDELRAEASAVVNGLHAAGITTVAMLTGDNERTAAALASQAGIDRVHAELLPTDKVRIVTDLQQTGPTAMVGDGINDAPALATADVGIAIGAIGSDVAIEAADVALMGDGLTVLPAALEHAHRAGRIMRQNLVLSAAILLTLIPLAATGVLGLATVVATHELAEVVIIANGLRASRRPRFEHTHQHDATPAAERNLVAT